MQGITILSTGSQRRRYITNCIASIKRHMPDMPIHAVTDVPLDVPFSWVVPRVGRASRYYKTQLDKYSPFEMTLILDDDTFLMKPLPDFSEVLADASVAMKVDSYCSDIGNACSVGVDIGWCSRPEANHTIGTVPPEFPHFNSGVMFVRRKEAAPLFERWHQEWMRFQDVDQLALARSLHGLSFPVKKLPADFNLSPLATTPESAPYIKHFGGGKNKPTPKYEGFVRRMGGDSPKHRLYTFYSHTVDNGICTREQYEAIGKMIHDLHPCRLLVWGCGHDSELWAALNARGRTLFVEDDPAYASRARAAGLTVADVSYPTRRGVDAGDMPAPTFLSEPWDAVFVDAPKGLKHSTPGRELPFRWTAQIASAPLVVAHDMERPWEAACAKRYLGEHPDFFIWGKKPHEGTLAFWTRNRWSAHRLL